MTTKFNLDKCSDEPVTINSPASVFCSSLCQYSFS